MLNRELQQFKRDDMIQLLMEAKRGKLLRDEEILKDNRTGFNTGESDIGRKLSNREWTDDDLVAQALLFFIAGFDSVATSLVFLLYELAVNSDVQNKLASEIKENWEHNEGIINYYSLQEMIYLDMVVSESLRLWPPLLAERMCNNDYNLGKPNTDAIDDYIIRKGEGIIIPIWSIHRSPEYYTDPCKFKPERFSKENMPNINPISYMPFGFGPRSCIGSRFALCEIKIAVYLLLLHIELSPAEKTKVPVELENAGMNLRMKGGHWIRMKIRK